MSDDDVTTRQPSTPGQDATDDTSGSASGLGVGGDLLRRGLRGLTHEVPADRDGGTGRAVLLSGLAFSWLGFLGHQFFLYPALPLLSDTTRRLGIVAAVLALAVIVRGRLHALLLALLLWGFVLLVVAFDSAVPFGLLDVEPAPSFTLYAAHLVLGAAQVPLIASAWGRLWGRD